MSEQQKLDVTIIGGGMIVTDLILPSVYQMQRTGMVGSVHVCDRSNVPLKALNHLLALDHAARANADDEMAVLVVKIGSESVGLIVDDFHETAEIIQKPLTGVLGGLAAYSGSALMGDGSVLMVLNVKEIV